MNSSDPAEPKLSTAQLPEQTPPSPHRQSQYSTQYEAFFADLPHDQNGGETCTPLHDMPISEEYSRDLRIKVCYHTTDYQVVVLRLLWHHFSTKVAVYNHDRCSPSHRLPAIGSNANIYPYSHNQEHSVVKCYPISNQEFEVVFVQVLTQYFLFKIASLHHCGPSTLDCMGFHIVVYYDCIEYSVEKCLTKFAWKQEYAGVLKKKLQRLHQLQLVHRDIKPDNICLSPTLQQPVFIDYGYSFLVKQHPGQASLSCFTGSLSYSSPQMEALFQKHSSAYIDLFYNDVFSLRQTLSELQANVTPVQLQDKLSHHTDSLFAHSILECSPYHAGQEQLHEQIRAQYESLRVKYFILAEQPRLLQSENLQTMQINPSDYLEFIHKLPYSQLNLNLCEIIRYVCRSQLRQNSRAYNLQQKKGNMFKGQLSTTNSTVNSSKNSFQQHYKWLKNEVTLISCQVGSYSISNESLSEQLLSESKVEKMQEEDYYRKLSLFLDFRTFRSTFEQKVQASRIMLQKTGDKDCRLMEPIEVIRKCLLGLLEDSLSSATIKRSDCLHIIYGDLYLLDLINEQQMVSYLQRIVDKDGEPLHKIRLLFRLAVLGQWILNKSDSMLTSNSLCFQYSKTIYAAMKTAELNSAGAVCKVVQYCKWAFVKNAIGGTYELKPFIKDKQMIHLMGSQFENEVKIYLVYSRLRQIQNKKMSWITQPLVCEIMNLEQALYTDTPHFDYYYFATASVSSEATRPQTITYAYQQLEKCLQIPSKVKTYALYYDYQATLLNAGKISILELADKVIAEHNIGLLLNCEAAIDTLMATCVHLFTISEQTQRQVKVVRQKLKAFLNLDEIQLRIFPTLSYLHTHQSLYQTYYRLSCLIYTLYSGTPSHTSTNFLWRLRQKMDQNLVHFSCDDCRHRSYEFTILVHVVCLQSSQDHKTLTILLTDHLKESRTVEYSSMILQRLLESLFWVTNYHPQSMNKRQCFGLALEIIRFNKLYHLLFDQDRIYKMMELLTIHKDDLQGLVRFSNELLSYLVYHSSSEQLKNYISNVSAFWKAHPELTHSTIKLSLEFLKPDRGLWETNGQYIALFYVLLLPYIEPTHQISYSRLFLYIFDSMHNIILQARHFILKTIYEHIIRHFSAAIQLVQHHKLGGEKSPTLQVLDNLLNNKTHHKIARMLRMYLKRCCYLRQQDMQFAKIKSVFLFGHRSRSIKLLKQRKLVESIKRYFCQ